MQIQICQKNVPIFVQCVKRLERQLEGFKSWGRKTFRKQLEMFFSKNTRAYSLAQCLIVVQRGGTKCFLVQKWRPRQKNVKRKKKKKTKLEHALTRCRGGIEIIAEVVPTPVVVKADKGWKRQSNSLA